MSVWEAELIMTTHKKINIYGYSVVSFAHLRNATSKRYPDDQVISSLLSVTTFTVVKNIQSLSLFFPYFSRGLARQIM